MNLHEAFYIAGMVGDGSGTNEASYSLIERININETGVSIIMRTSEPDGTPYDFSKAIVKIAAPRGTTTVAGQINFNSKCISLWRNDLISASSESVSIAKLSIDNGFANTMALCASSITERVTPTYKCELVFMEMKSIQTITTFTDPSTVYFPVGTVIEIYAVRK